MTDPTSSIMRTPIIKSTPKSSLLSNRPRPPWLPERTKSTTPRPWSTTATGKMIHCERGATRSKRPRSVQQHAAKIAAKRRAVGPRMRTSTRLWGVVSWINTRVLTTGNVRVGRAVARLARFGACRRLIFFFFFLSFFYPAVPRHGKLPKFGPPPPPLVYPCFLTPR